MGSAPASAFLCIFVVLCSYVTVNGGYIKYNTGAGIVEGKLNVHLVPHSHDDVGWLKTIDQYYVGSNNSIQGACVENVLDSVVESLLRNQNRKFVFAEMVNPQIASFFFWYSSWLIYKQSNLLKSSSEKTPMEVNGRNQGKLLFSVDGGMNKVRKYRNSRKTCRWWPVGIHVCNRCIFVLRNGGWCMHDEATVHYIDMIDQTTLGHRLIKKAFNKAPRAGWQIDPFGHSAVQAYLLGAELGFDSVHFARIDYQDRAKRKEDKSLEVIWRGSKTFGSTSQIFTNAFPVHYSPPNGFGFEIDDFSIPVQDNPHLFDYNVEQRINDFVAAALVQVNS
ncbi:Alpha-mannosidase [Vitis vinifera]|uniref:Alpha-mannosidase n=1 Tax=Vitis vinifera TaxID=29760 RepID=A0A438EV59_VITVI|nr:Alpha-mannosidase [Vitis vinifera]